MGEGLSWSEGKRAPASPWSVADEGMRQKSGVTKIPKSSFCRPWPGQPGQPPHFALYTRFADLNSLTCHGHISCLCFSGLSLWNQPPPRTRRSLPEVKQRPSLHHFATTDNSTSDQGRPFLLGPKPMMHRPIACSSVFTDFFKFPPIFSNFIHFTPKAYLRRIY